MTDQQKELLKLKTRLSLIGSLLKIAKCPNCDGSGMTSRQISERTFVTREMAMDAGDPSLEGHLFTDDEWVFEQCHWCHERRQVIDELEEESANDDGN